jgi:hypothetical protein
MAQEIFEERLMVSEQFLKKLNAKILRIKQLQTFIRSLNDCHHLQTLD